MNSTPDVQYFVAATLGVLGRYVPTALVTPERLRLILPYVGGVTAGASVFYGFECRLTGDDPKIDFPLPRLLTQAAHRASSTQSSVPPPAANARARERPRRWTSDEEPPPALLPRRRGTSRPICRSDSGLEPSYQTLVQV